MKTTTYETGATQFYNEHREILNAEIEKMDAVMMPKKKRGTYQDHIFQIDGYDFVLYNGADVNFRSKDTPYKNSSCTDNGGTWFLANLDAPFPRLTRPVTGMNVFAVNRSMGYARWITYYDKRQTGYLDDVSWFLENVEDELQKVRSVWERKSWFDASA